MVDLAAERPCVFVVNDDTAFLQLMEQLLDDEGYRAVTLGSSKNARGRIAEEQPDLVVLDIRLNSQESDLLLLDLLSLDPATRSIPVIVASANLQPLASREVELAERGIYVLAKPFDIDDLATLTRMALAARPVT